MNNVGPELTFYNTRILKDIPYLLPGSQVEIQCNESFEVTTVMSRQVASKLGSTFGFDVGVIKVGMQLEMNYQQSNQRTTTYKKSISTKLTKAFSKEMEAQGYNCCVIYSGLFNVPSNVYVDVYEIESYTYRKWFLGKKHTGYRRGRFVGTKQTTMDIPYAAVFEKYYKANLKSAPLNVTFDKNDTQILTVS